MNQLELKVPPVIVMAIAAAIMWAIAYWFSSLTIDELPTRALAIVFGSTGTLFGVAGVWSFRKAQTTVNPTRPDTSSSVVTSGIYRITRNPMYLGMLFLLLGWGSYLANPLSLVVLPAFVGYMNRFQIVPEERILAEKFGDEYQNYLQSVRRWL